MRHLYSWTICALLAATLGGWAAAQQSDSESGNEKVTLDFQETELTDVINMISRLTNKDLRSLYKSREVPELIRRMARRTFDMRNKR